MSSSTMPLFNTQTPEEAQLRIWEKQLWDQGYLIIPNALPLETCAHFKRRLEAMPEDMGYGYNSAVRLFEQGMDFVQLLQNEPVFTLMERVLGANLHIIALQGHRMNTGNEVLGWHSDEIYLQRRPEDTDEVPYPAVINVINCHYYVMDVPEELGPTQVVPGSHNACRQPRPEDGTPPRWQGREALSLTVNAGDCVLYSNQAWHRGSPNRTDRTRLAVVPAYARRFVAQRFWPFLNYHLSRDILDKCTPRQRELLGEHPRGAYG